MDPQTGDCRTNRKDPQPGLAEDPDEAEAFGLKAVSAGDQDTQILQTDIQD